MEFLSDGMIKNLTERKMELWNIGLMELGKYGFIESWNYGTIEWWNNWMTNNKLLEIINDVMMKW